MNHFDIALAFIEGLALIASPCILPVLPLVLSASIDGGRARPFGIITGFVLAFSAFVLLARRVVEAFSIDTESIRIVSLVLLFGLGLVLLFDRLSAAFARLTQGAAAFGGKYGAGEGGFVSGIFIGSLIGLVWTPCAGPILAAVLVQVIRQQTDLQSVFVTLAFALGAGIPMFVIALVGRKAIQRFGFLSHHAEAVRKVFGVLILLSVGFLAFGSAVPGGDDKPVPVHDAGRLEEPLEHPYPAPELTGIQEWLNSKPLSIAQLRGKVVLIDFWTYSCINCVRTLPSITAWDRQYRDKGLVIIGVHAPEFEFEKNIANIRAALIRHGIAYPVAVDNRLESWGAFHNQYWPAHYLIDQEGRVVYTHFGEGDYAVTENNIRYLLGLKDKVAAEDEAPASVNQTPETYLGYGRAENFLSLSGRQEDMPALYQPAAALPEHHWTLSGKWKIEEQKIVAQEDGAVLRLNFTARKLFLVMGNAEGKAQKAVLRLNGKALGESSGKDVQDSAVTIARPTLYELVSQPHRQNALLEIQLPAGVEAYAFTFGE